jgi:diguanylate cyclase (GGDEF)-like protein
MNSRMRDRGLLLAMTAAVAALVAGVLAVVLDAPAFGLAAGIAGMVAGAGGASIAARAHHASQRFDEADIDRRRLRRELDALTALLEEEVQRRESHADAERTAAEERSAVAERTFDPATGLYDQSYFPVLAQQQVAAARRSLRPVSVVIFEVDGMTDVDDMACDQALTAIGDIVLRRTLRESDAACRLGGPMIGAILEDTPEAGGVWAAERVRGSLLGSPLGDTLTVSAGVACYPTHALGAAELVAAAGRALEEARTRGADRVEVAPEV